MNKLIMETLSPLNLPVFFIAQGENNSYPQIIFNIKENGWEYEDDRESGRKYEINMSLLSKGDYLDLKEKIEELMIKSNFKKGTGYYPEYNAQLETYVVPLRFYYYKINKGEINNG